MIMDKNIVFFDIDGTLLSEKTKLIPNSAKEAINKIRENGHLAFINTGRPISEITTQIRDLGFDGYVCGCGTYIEYNGKILLYKSLGEKISKEIALDMTTFNLEGILEGSQKIYFDNPENITNKTILDIINQHKHEGFFQARTWHEDDIDIDKLVIFLRKNSNFEGFYEKYKDIFEFIKRDEDFYELVPLGYSKASGIEYLINHLNIPHKNTYAIGDSTNDLSMLNYVENSIAMGNSHPDLFKSVSYITKEVDEDGVFLALNHYNMI